jgi:hypothetical protein
MANRRIGGVIFLTLNGEMLQAKGEFTYNIGIPKKEMVVGADGVHGFKEMIQVPFIEGAITDSDTLDLATLQKTRDATITLQLANGKTIAIEEAIYAAEGSGKTEEGEIEVRFEGIRGRELN